MHLIGSTFQLPLSGSLWALTFTSDTAHQPLSTPSLGITERDEIDDESERLFRFQLPLSGSLKDTPELGQARVFDFQLPLSGSPT
jgi:hypothetical protein